MKSLLISINTEYMKMRKSKVIWIVTLVIMFIPMMMSLLFYIAKNPDLAAKLGLIGTKAEMFGLGDWKSYMDLLMQLIAVLGLIGFGFVTSWIFGREYADRTVNDILALPLSRTYFVLAKLIVAILFCLFLTIILIIFGFIMGRVIEMPGRTGEMAAFYIYKFFITSFLTITLCTPVAFFASYGRGYLLAIGFIIFTLILAQIAGVIGAGPYFPWAIPGIYSLPQSSEGMEINTASYYILFITGLVGLFGTIAWWRLADQK